MATPVTNRDYTSIDQPYDNYLNRSNQPADNSSTSTPNLLTNNPGGTEENDGSIDNGSVEKQPVKSDGGMADLWISNLIRSTNWKPKKTGFYIDGQSGYAEFTDVFVSGTIENLGGIITGSVIVSENGAMMSGQTDFNTGIGWFIGNSGGVPKLSIGNPAADRLTWDGNELDIAGRISLNGTNITVSDPTEIQPALDEVAAAGGGTVFLEPGTYVLTSDILVPSSTTLQGVSRDNVVIDCNGAYSVQIVGSDPYTTGTISVTFGDTFVVGVATNWDDSVIGKSIWLDGLWYPIIARIDSTHIELDSSFQGTDLLAESYLLANINHTTKLAKFTLFGATGSGVICRYTLEPTFDDLYVYGCGTGMDFDYCQYPLVVASVIQCGINLDFNYTTGFEVRFSAFDQAITGAGIVMTNSGDATFFDNSVSSNTGNGMSLTNCRNLSIWSADISGNGGHGIELISGNTYISIITANPLQNNGDGIKLTASNDNNFIGPVAIHDNGGYGVNIAAASCDNNLILSPVFSNNTSGNINDAGTSTKIV